VVILGSLLLIAAAALIALLVKRGARGVAVAVLIIVTLVGVPLAILGVLTMGFSSEPADTRLGAFLLFGSLIIGGGIAWLCVVEMKRAAPH
jgi:uncharacterized membrane protein